MARKEEFYFTSSCGTTKIHAVRYIPEGNITAILQITHGMVEYIERYEDFALFMASKGFLVTGHDHLGHGKSINSKEEWGYFAKEDGNKAVLYDIYQLTQITKEAYPNLPYFLLGHSMGSFYTRQYLCQFGQELDGAIVMGTGCQPLALVKSGMLLIQIISLFLYIPLSILFEIGWIYYILILALYNKEVFLWHERKNSILHLHVVLQKFMRFAIFLKET